MTLILKKYTLCYEMNAEMVTYCAV
jgi:hypothetical protein